MVEFGAEGNIRGKFSFAREIIIRLTSFFFRNNDAQFGRPSPTRHLDYKIE